MKKISNKDFLIAEKKAFDNDLPIRDTVFEHSGDEGDLLVIEPCKVLELVKPRANNAHKGCFGKLVFICGSDRYPGAAQLASLAALRSGVGLLQVITTKRSAISLSSKISEATLFPLDADKSGFMDSRGYEDELAQIISSADAVLVGCGLGTTHGPDKILDLATQNAKKTLILDADGINLVSRRIECLKKTKAKLVLTPHPAELARLCRCDIKYVTADRFTYAKRISDEYGATVVAKSSSTIIVGDGKAFLSVVGNSGLARGGSGDLLAGLISSFAAQGISTVDSAAIGVTLQGICCEMASERLSRRGMLPSDILEELPRLFKKIER